MAFWFHLSCDCGFETSTAAVGTAEYGERKTEHEEYYVAWLDPNNGRLCFDAFKIPLDLHQEHGTLERWLLASVLPRIQELYANLIWLPPLGPTYTTQIPCPNCGNGLLSMVAGNSPHLGFTLNIDAGCYRQDIRHPDGRHHPF